MHLCPAIFFTVHHSHVEAHLYSKQGSRRKSCRRNAMSSSCMFPLQTTGQDQIARGCFSRISQIVLPPERHLLLLIASLMYLCKRRYVTPLSRVKAEIGTHDIRSRRLVEWKSGQTQSSVNSFFKDLSLLISRFQDNFNVSHKRVPRVMHAVFTLHF